MGRFLIIDTYRGLRVPLDKPGQNFTSWPQRRAWHDVLASKPMSLRDESSGRLLSLAVHELRTPAGIVGGYLRMLERESPLNERQRKMVAEAQKACQQLVGLIEELSEIQKLDANLIALERQPFELFHIVGEAVEEARRQGDVQLQVTGQTTGAPVDGDVARLKAAVATVLRAVLRDTAPDTPVVVDRQLKDVDGVPSAVVIIADQERAAAPLDADSAPFDEGRGGLGLAVPIARRIIRRHGGQVRSPIRDGGRAVAIISLPISGIGDQG